ncbi:hypothetical protein D3C71_1152350 [compost metagenome]
MVLPPLISIPFFAALPRPTMTAVGVANPMAHGQDTTSVAIAFMRDCWSGNCAIK